MSYILSPGGFVESSFTFLDLAGLDHHVTASGGARQSGTNILVIADCLPCSLHLRPWPFCLLSVLHSPNSGVGTVFLRCDNTTQVT
jgi:hypothetical protein